MYLSKLFFLIIGMLYLSCGNLEGAVKNNPARIENKAQKPMSIPKEEVVEVGVLPEMETTEGETKVMDTRPSNEISAGRADTILAAKALIPEEIPVIPDHTAWTSLLSKYVTDDGDVYYKNFAKDIDALKGYLGRLAKNAPTDSWSKNDRLAYYINLYNAATVKLIIDNYPLKSIKDIKGPWDKKIVAVGDKMLSLGEIEHKILRKMDEPRIHFAINCASYSCPKLGNVAFKASTMEQQLERMTKDFVNDAKRNRIAADKVQLSQIFKWYKKDFTTRGPLIDYINTYTKTPVASNAKITYLTYDWNLNEAK